MNDKQNKEIGILMAERYAQLKEPLIYHKKATNPTAKLAAEMLERWGMVAGINDGEDSAGRMKLRLLTPQELVTRACDVAELAMEEFDKRGWVIDIPPPVEKDI